MATRAMKALPDEPASEGAFNRVTVRTKAGEYTFQELSGTAYDKAVKLSTNDEGLVDSVQLLRWMAINSSLEPKLTAEKLGELPMTARSQILSKVNDLHFPEDEPAPAADEGDDDPNS